MNSLFPQSARQLRRLEIEGRADLLTVVTRTRLGYSQSIRVAGFADAIRRNHK